MQDIDRIVALMPSIRTRLEEEGIQPNSGDCGNLALALKKIIGGNVYCSYENYGFAQEGEPAHCMLKINDSWIDADGKHTDGEQRLKDWAFNEAYPEDEENITTEWEDSQVYTDAISLFNEIYSEDTTNNIQKIIEEMIA